MSKKTLNEFPFDEKMISCQNRGVFPDLAIRLNVDKNIFSGGELIELKDSKSYNVSSFNSTIPTGKKEIAKVIKGENSIVKKQMEKVGDVIDSLPVRDVYYLVRGIHKKNIKVVLIHGSFFETVKSADLISQSFGKVLNECLQEKELDIGKNIKDLLVDIFSEQESFSKVRNVDKASVKLRFRIMTEVRAEGNILNPKKYPEIPDNTINLIIPCHNKQDEELTIKRFSTVCDISQFKQLKIKHHLNGYFIVFQQNLKITKQ
ncbi:MAG: hypothetical protein LBC74_08545 [Planctomycetaceae bacterium]|nr:hypothetical protein [Planctomycetaceae bacterium]